MSYNELSAPLVASLRNVSKAYGSMTVLEAVDLDIAQGEFLCLLGPSGCGKSTILRLLAGLSKPTGGKLEMPARSPADIGVVFQEPTLLPWATVSSNVALPLKLWKRPASEIAREVSRVLEMVKLTGFEQAYPRELSGGMKMRVSIARALVTKPKLLLMDEPFAALDEITRARLDDDLLAIQRDSGCTVVFVTHSTPESVYLATRIAVMRTRPSRFVGFVDVPASAIRDKAYRVSQQFVETTTQVSELLDED
ncbi:ABC transporter ATP-binding protein [Ensifer adhaerens]|uniref:ABC transporter ATP-binding protein n=1 Tax=Ensifer adhaerens TaxID=106592 RepID=UPI001CBB5C7B|nr:ABC transporter ATP-binding protein [Ensifer adhaerens]MBZ7927734.1 ABC transporter ATP-binding protein [Ensifer adhaerens]UAX96623.1 ABC transporter ATP-binding protein [Ensifer adhaerens]UAY04033.1 ABC transporter ATP-binding protein [Ensifer adhaerens]UAY12019.1 ABC transporter ATP-binding protein [Ensifer adhaerens]